MNPTSSNLFWSVFEVIV